MEGRCDGGMEPDIALECTNAKSTIGATIEAMVGVRKGEMMQRFMQMSTKEVDIVTSGTRVGI